MANRYVLCIALSSLLVGVRSTLPPSPPSDDNGPSYYQVDYDKGAAAAVIFSFVGIMCVVWCGTLCTRRWNRAVAREEDRRKMIQLRVP
eukprot:CAMPEP_0115849432 /NCGR_PEP_ID=MMETSP0287-20121206/11447_1 /TAXON_ID=412157 /ORGANISM="Chrysochromulina rotalis, Strain UIO044" /LENGTH=88 /DNA_ID=CAMNT_0003303401 /DNA_START=109 /DNA_END=375 /DNA_ORIENTATION=+